MKTATYHLESVDDMNPELLKALKLRFQSNPVCLVISEEVVEDDDLLLTEEIKAELDEALMDSDEGEMSGEESIGYFKQKYGI